MRLVNNERYIVCLNFNFNKLYVIWVSDEEDCVLTADDNKILTFDNKKTMLAYANEHGFILNDDVTTYEIDKLQQWVLNPVAKLNAELFLNFWNLCTDISVSIKKSFAGDIRNQELDNLYDKLFETSGPVFMLADQDITLNNDELFRLKEMMEQGLMLLLDNLHIK